MVAHMFNFELMTSNTDTCAIQLSLGHQICLALSYRIPLFV